MNLERYVANRKKELRKIKAEVSLLDKIDFPVILMKSHSGIYLFSKDYSKATDFKIGKDRESGSSYSGYDGGYKNHIYHLFPKFYFNISENGSKMPVRIGNGRFERDEKTVFLEIRETQASGEYMDHARGPTKHEPNDLEDVCKYLKRKRLNKDLLLRFQKRANKILRARYVF